MHILFFTSEFPPDPGGIATYIDHTARMLSRAGHRVTIFAPGEVRRDERLPDGARLIRVVPHQTTSVPRLFRTLSHWPALSYQFAQALIDHLRSGEDTPDVIEVQEYGALGYYLLQRRLVDDTPLSNVPILVHLHSPHSENLRVNQAARYRFPDYWVGQMEKFCINAADALLCPSVYLKHRLLERGFTDQPIDVIPYPGVDPEARTEEAAPIEPRRGDLVYIGRLEVRKGVLPLVSACARLWAEGVDFRLTLIGGDTEYAPRGTTVGAFLRRKYPRWIGNGRLVLSGPMSRGHLMARMRAAWAVVVPSLYENYPYTCLEAMSAGKVVIASTSGGQAEMVGAESAAGQLFDWAERGSLERAAMSVLNANEADHRAMGACARGRIAALASYDAILPQRIEHYRQSVDRAGGRRSRRLFPTVNWDLRPTHVPQDEAALRDGLLSVVIPFYNLGAYVEDTLDSVLASTYRPLEVIVLDDGSDDLASLEALERICARGDAIVRIVRTTNRGLASARNEGADAARGEFLAFIDADDRVRPEFFARAMRVLRSFDNVGFVYSWVQYFGDNDEWWPTWNAEFPYLLGHNMLVPIVVVRHGAFQKCARNRPVLEYNYEDWDAWVRLAAAGYAGVSLPDRLVEYHVRRDSMFRRMRVDQALYLHDLIARGSPDLYQRYAIELSNLLNANGPHYRWVHPAMPAQPSPYTLLKAFFFWLAARPGLGWLHRLKRPLKRLYTRWHS